MTRLATLLLLLPLLGPPRTSDPLAAGRAHAAEGRWEEAAAELREHLKRAVGEPDVLELYGRALLELERADEAAHHLEAAAAEYDARRERRGAAEARRLLSRADPFATRRESLLRNLTTQLQRAAERLAENGHVERALALLERAEPIAAGKDADELRALLAQVRARFEAVDLDRAGGDAPADGAHPLIELESEHYRLACNLEEDVVRLVADTMDDIHAYYVDLYFDGDERKAAAPKATIRVHPDKESMLAGWGGGSAPEGWWSPGENQVTCYDTRTSTGSLDWMLTTLFHEASHQFMTLLSRKGGWAPAWLNEGTASFFEGAVAMADHRVLWPDAALPRLTSLAAMLQGGSGPALADVLGFAGGGSYPAEYYPFGWGLVYFLQQYEDPETLEYVYRPLYARYRETITTKGGDPMALFEEVFLSSASPLGHRALADFERDWRAWILEGVRPLHVGPAKERRALRTARVERYLAAADLAAGDRRARVQEDELLRRALGHLEHVRTLIDGAEATDVELFLKQADVLERLELPESAAPLLEALLDRADAGELALDEERYAELERRLKKLDASNWALRSARSKIEGLARSTRRLVEDYREQGMVLRAYTLAAAAGGALDDEEALLPLAEELREAARAEGRLLGSVRPLEGTPAAWTTIHTAQPKELRVGPGSVLLESVRPIAFVCEELSVGEEYELRARLARHGELFRSSAHAVVLAAGPGVDWYAVGFDGEGQAALWRIRAGDGGGASTRLIESLYLDEPLAPDERPRIAVHVSGGRHVELRVEGRAPLAFELPGDHPGGRHVGVYVKDGRLELIDPVLELYP